MTDVPVAGVGPVRSPVPARNHPAAPPAPGLPDPDVVAAAVLGCSDVVALSRGPYGEVATYLPGRRVEGVRITEDRVVVHVIARYGPPLPEVAARIHRILGRLVQQPVDVVIDDISPG